MERGKGEKEKGGLGKEVDKLKEEEGVTFRALPESIGFHAEGRAETFFIV